MKEKIELKIRWAIPWAAGFLFTLGFIDHSALLLETTDKMALIGYLVLSYFIWPVFLGAQLGGNF